VRKGDTEAMRFPPEAFLIGAMKSGTTTLAHLLGQHPRVMLSRPLECDYFTRHYVRGESWYRSLFTGPPDAVLLDSSNSYSAAPVDEDTVPSDSSDHPFIGVPRRIHALNPEAKFIYVLRDPVTRTYSDYWHMVRTGEEHEPFRVAIERKDQYYFRLSDYRMQIERYLKFFPLDAFLFLVFEEFVADPAAGARRCFEFLGIEPLPLGDGGSRKNASFQYTGFGRLLANCFPSPSSWKTFTQVAKRLTPAPLVPLATRILAKGIPPLGEDDRRYLTEQFRDRNRRLEDLIGITLDRWHR
jgi:hypothetical protein